MILLIACLLWIVLRLADPIGRLFGLILTAIAVEIMAKGLRGLFPALSG